MPVCPTVLAERPLRVNEGAPPGPQRRAKTLVRCALLLARWQLLHEGLGELSRGTLRDLGPSQGLFVEPRDPRRVGWGR